MVDTEVPGAQSSKTASPPRPVGQLVRILTTTDHKLIGKTARDGDFADAPDMEGREEMVDERLDDQDDDPTQDERG